MRLPIVLTIAISSMTLAGCQTTPLFYADFNSDPVGRALAVPAGSPNNSARVINAIVSDVNALEGTKSLVVKDGSYIATLQDDRADPNSTNLYYSWEQQIRSGELFINVQYGIISPADRTAGNIGMTIVNGNLAVDGTEVGSCDFSRDVFFLHNLERVTGTLRVDTFGRGCHHSHETTVPAVMLGSLENRVPSLWFILEGETAFARFDTIKTSYKEPTVP